MSPIGATRGGGITTAMLQRAFLSHTSDLGRHTEPGSFVAAAVEAVLRLDLECHLDLEVDAAAG